MSVIARTRILCSMLLVLAPAVAQADNWAKVNDVIVEEDGSVQVWASVLDRFGRAPAMSDLEYWEVSFGEANTFSGEDLDHGFFGEVGPGTDYVLIIPGYEGFGVNNAVATAEGAGWFQRTYVNEETDTSLVLVYGDGVLPHDGDASELAPTFQEPDGIMRAARPYMLSALDEAIRYFDELPTGRRRVIILVGTGLDVQLGEASMVRADTTDYNAARRQVLFHHQNILREYMNEVNAVHARIYTIGFNETRADYLEVLSVLARKTGGSYRRVRNIGVLATSGGDGSHGVFELVGKELERELVLTPDFTLSEGDYEIWAKFRFYDDSQNRILADVTTRPFYLTYEETDKKLNLIPYLIAIGIILIVVFLLAVIALAMARRAKSTKSHDDEIKRLQAIVAAGAVHCRNCYRPTEPDWQQCMFCASGMPPLPEQPQAMLDAEEAKKALDELEGRTEPVEVIVAGTAGAAAAVAAQQGKRQCPTCFRVMENDWTQCLFCAAGMEPLPMEAPLPVEQEVAKPVPMYGAYQGDPAAGAAPPGGAPPQAAQPAHTIAITPGAGVCPQCDRPVPPEWTECLYCKAGV